MHGRGTLSEYSLSALKLLADLNYQIFKSISRVSKSNVSRSKDLNLRNSTFFDMGGNFRDERGGVPPSPSLPNLGNWP